jgi:3-hydroxyisobutyrate dehydrogenase
MEKIGFIGLGNIGKPIAENIARGGYEMSVYDIAGTTERAPAGTFISSSITEVAERSNVIILCLPSLSSIEAVVTEISQANVSGSTVVVNTSTAGPTAAIAAHDRLLEKGISYADAPISGSVSLAGEGRLAVMFSGKAGLFKRLEPVFSTFGNNLFNLGIETGHGQRMKVLNNSLIHTAFVITSEALAFGEIGGLDMKTMLDVINVSSGQNFATHHFFPKHVLTGTYDSASRIAISRKDIGLFVEEAKRQGCRHVVAEAAFDVITELDEESPGVDQTMIYPYTRDGGQA